MSSEIEAVGGLVTAGLAANSLDGPGSDGPAKGDVRHGDHCINCGAVLHGSFCANCGQAAHVHRSLAHVGEEFLHGITHFDGKAWKTLPMLLFRPGRLTREYIFGKRARYVAPVPLFLLVVFLMFLVFALVGGDAVTLDDQAAKFTPAQARAALAKAEGAVVELDAELAKARAGQTGAKVPGQSLGGLETAHDMAAAYRDRLALRASGKTLGGDQIGLAEGIKKLNDEGKLNVDLPSEEFNRRARHALANPELALYKIQGKAYKFSFLLVPLSLPWLWLVFFWRRNVRMYDHAVFALYSISFMSLLFVAVSLLAAAGIGRPGLLFALGVGAPLAHMFAQLKGTYALGNFSAAWRTAFLATASLITLSIYASLMVVIGLID